MEFQGLQGLILLLVWIALPFAVFGIKGRLDRLIEEIRKNNELLRELYRKFTR